MFGAILMWILAWLTATPVRSVRAALNRVEKGDFDTNLVVFDGTELGQLQRGFSSMVAGLRQRRQVRQLFGQHVGREVAELAEKERPKLGGEERHAAVIFVDIIRIDPAGDQSSRRRGRRAAQPVLRRRRRRGRPPPRPGQQVRGRRYRPSGLRGTDVPGEPRRRSAGRRPCDGAALTRVEVPRMSGRHQGGGKGRWWPAMSEPRSASSTTVIGEPVNEAARLCRLSKRSTGTWVASAVTVQRAGETESAHWALGETVTLRGHDEPTRLAVPA